MKSMALLLLLLSTLCSCASLRMGEWGVMNRYTLSRDLSRAVKLLETGDSPGAVRLLTDIVVAPGIPGITDEALFRLALFNLRPTAEKEGNLQALQLLKRLRKDYPFSLWTAQSSQLAEYLAGVEEMRRQNRNYRTLNQALTSEVNELNRNIGQLKRLDQELEQQRR
jgi:hypothetical protein